MAFSAAGPAAAADGDEYIRGVVRDNVTDEPLPYVTVRAEGSDKSMMTDARGIFEMNVSPGVRHLILTSMGYDRLDYELRRNSMGLYAIYLTPSTTELRELEVRKGRYSKRNNPAVDFANRLRSASRRNDPRTRPYYSFDKYERTSLALNDFSEADSSSWMFRKFPFLWEHVDTSEISGKRILNVSTREKMSHVAHRSNPESEKVIVDGLRHEGVDEIVDAASMEVFLNEVLREVDVYDESIALFRNRFVSPLSRIAPNFYRFYLTDTVDLGGEKCVELSYYPRNPASFGFNGHIYVPAGDTSMFVKKITMTSPRDINLNFIDKLYLTQTYAKAPDGARLKSSDILTAELSLTPGARGMYVKREVLYGNHSFDAVDDSVFAPLAHVSERPGARERSAAYWDASRMSAMSVGERRVGSLIERLRKVPVYYWGEKILKVFVNGYIPTSRDSKFDIGPVNTTVSGNTLEGVRLRVGGMTTANLSKRWFGRSYVAWGTRDKKWKYQAELEYSFVDKDYHSREFPVHSLRLTYLYDVDLIGQKYLFTNMDNMFLAIKRMSNTHITYHRLTALDYTLELANNFSVAGRLSHERQEATRFMEFVTPRGQIYPHYNTSALTVTLRYAPGEKFYQSKTHRYPANLDAPVFTLGHTVAPRGVGGAPFTVNRTEASAQKRFWFSAFGYLDVRAKGGHVWSSVPYPDLLIPNSNLSYTIQPESFALLNPMEFMYDSYGSVFLTYWANGAILNYIPYIKKLKLREAFSFSGTWGHLSRRNNPAYNDRLFMFPDGAAVVSCDHGPYMEASVGINNIFKCLRVDYVWRLSYRDVPYAISRSGVRLALHFTF